MKQEVKQIMKATRPRPIWITLLYLLIVSAGAWVIQGGIGAVVGVGAIAGRIEDMANRMDTFMGYMDIEQFMEEIAEMLLRNVDLIGGLIAGSILISILSYLWSSTMSAGYVGYSLKMVRGQSADVGAVFSAFPKFGKVLITNILVGIFITLWTLLFAVAFGVVAGVGILLIAMEGIGAVIGGILLFAGYVALIVALLWATLRYALTNHLVMDHGISGLEALSVSKKLMKGNKGRLFVLQLSFIGWYLLELIVIYACVGIMALCGFLMAGGSIGGIVAGVILILVILLVMVVAILLFSMWLTPYTSGATVKFYEYTLSCRPDLFQRDQGTSTYSDDSFGNPNYPTLE